jgi:ApaG protein
MTSQTPASHAPLANSYLAASGPITVRVEPEFLPDYSHADLGRWVWAYKVEICNAGPETVQLLARRWIITDGLGQQQVVEGEGVVGEKPVLEAGQCFVYTSHVPLGTPSGFMAGFYRMITEDGIGFTARIPDFSLDSPEAIPPRAN